MTNHFASNLKYLRQKQNIDQVSLAEQFGKKGGSSVANWEKGLATPNIDVLEGLANLFGISVDEFIKEDLTKKKQLSFYQLYSRLNKNNKSKVTHLAKRLLDEEQGIAPLRHEIQLYGAVSAGTGEFLPDGQQKETITYEGSVPAHDYAVVVNGQSMEPMFEDKQIIFVNQGKEARSGQIVIAKYDGSEVYVKKFVQDDKGCRLVSLNKAYQDMIIDNDHPAEIMGTVVL